MKMAKASLLAAAVLCAAIRHSAPARAEPAPVIRVDGDDRPWNRGVPLPVREAARDLFLEGNRLFLIPVYPRAADRYAAALGTWKHPAIYFNLALAQLNLGQAVEARDSLEQALQHGAEPLGAERFAEARRQLHEVEHQLGRIRIRCATPDAEVSLDGATLFVGAGSRERWVKATAHEVTAKRPDYLSEARRLTVAPGQVQDVELRLITLDEASDSGRRWRPWKPWAVVATGGAIAIAGGVVHALSFKSFKDFDNGFSQLDCVKAGGCSKQQIGPVLSDQLATANREQQIAVGAYIAGGTVIAAGILLLYLNRPHLTEDDSPRASAGSVAIVPAVSPDLIGAVLRVSR
jgi:tetratricopeptide (TPR) repeat protein